MTKILAEIEPREALRKFVALHATQREAALALGIGESYLSDLLLNRRDFSDAMLEKLGLRRIVVQS